MMMMMVRKVGEGPILPGEEPPQSKIITIKGRKGRGTDEEEFALAGEPVGEVAESEPLMMGKEVDESTLQTQRVVEQIAELVKEDPQISANILQRWIDADK
jgi:flagellar biosynthesis/type III secretory pathway M-ring protein FliF/YscJ